MPPFMPPIGPLGAPGVPGMPGMPLPGIPRPDFGALFDQQQQQSAPASPLPLAPSGQPSALVPPAQQLAPSISAPDRPETQLGPRAAGKGLGVEPIFASIGDYLGSVNQLTQVSDAKQRDLAMGKDVELHDVMIAAEKASVAVQLTAQVRNKLVESYQEIMRMQV